MSLIKLTRFPLIPVLCDKPRPPPVPYPALAAANRRRRPPSIRTTVGRLTPVARFSAEARTPVTPPIPPRATRAPTLMPKLSNGITTASTARIPTLIDPDGPGGRPLTLIQSWAILYYLAEKTGKLIPGDPLARARTYQWLGEAASDMAPTAQNIFFLGNRMPEKIPPSAIKFYEDRLVTQFHTADNQLARTPYLTGSEITVADLGLYPIYAGRKALIDGAGLRNVSAWGERVGARPGVQKGMKLER